MEQLSNSCHSLDLCRTKGSAYCQFIFSTLNLRLPQIEQPWNIPEKLHSIMAPSCGDTWPLGGLPDPLSPVDCGVDGFDKPEGFMLDTSSKCSIKKMSQKILNLENNKPDWDHTQLRTAEASLTTGDRVVHRTSDEDCDKKRLPNASICDVRQAFDALGLRMSLIFYDELIKLFSVGCQNSQGATCENLRNSII